MVCVGQFLVIALLAARGCNQQVASLCCGHMFAVGWQAANTASIDMGDEQGEEGEEGREGEGGADQTGDWEGKARSEETGEKFQDTVGQ